MFFKKTEPTLVLKKFQVDKSIAAARNIEIHGRTPGLMSWILTLLRVDNETSLVVNKSGVDYKTSSFFGERTVCVPIAKISSTSCGFRKPMQYLILAAIFFLSGSYVLLNDYSLGIFSVNAIIGGLFLLSYFLKKSIFISIQSSGAINVGMKFKRSIIENVDVNVQKAREAIHILNALTKNSGSLSPKTAVVKAAPAAVSKKPIPSSQPKVRNAVEPTAF
jgi:hypothetical protein